MFSQAGLVWMLSRQACHGQVWDLPPGFVTGRISSIFSQEARSLLKVLDLSALGRNATFLDVASSTF